MFVSQVWNALIMKSLWVATMTTGGEKEEEEEEEEAEEKKRDK